MRTGGDYRIIGALLACAATPALAQTHSGVPPPAAATSYLPDDFARFAPRTALDMVRQLPGFTIRTGDSERRGLGQATENVVVDGRRIASKSDDPETVLARIAAASVTRIDIVDGATLDIPGLAGPVANIITSAGAVTGSFAWNPQFRARRTKPRLLDGEVSIGGASGPLAYSLSFRNESNRKGNAGIETVTDALGVVTDRRPEVLFVYEEVPKLAGALRYDLPDGAVANLSASYERGWKKLTEDSTRVDLVRHFLERERNIVWEVGGDYDFALAGGRLKLIGLHRSHANPLRSPVVLSYHDGRPDSGERYVRDTDRKESILRGEYGWAALGGDWQVAAEGALNTLDNTSELANLAPSGEFVPALLHGADARVEEKRGEVMLSHGRPLAANLRLQASLGGEYSRIHQQGAGGLTRSFYRPKGSLSLAWKPGTRTDVSLKVSREVGQLDFFSFLASVDLSGGSVNAANPDLRPPQSWKGEVQLGHHLGPWGSVTARLFGALISDIVDQVPIGATGEAPGNLDSASEYGIKVDATLAFDPLGWNGAKLTVNALFQTNSVDDPLTGLPRRISDTDSREVTAELRWDIPGSRWAAGASYESWVDAPTFRLDQYSRSLDQPGIFGLFVENKNVMGLTMRASVANVGDVRERFYRTVWAARRGGPVAFHEDRNRYYGPVFTLGISGRI
ncbi:TonB-dependent receptor domain-containing protein [Sphingomonas flavalba]|uniref:TonB-dependent receptor domain-containing protein n=1 Tax=Sphingomonas flavalba TaxID=2559804 RepID=UPI0039DFCE0A